MKDSGNMSMGDLVDILPKDGTPVRIQANGQPFDVAYHGEWGYGDEGDK
jgi:hypothetical protein